VAPGTGKKLPRLRAAKPVPLASDALSQALLRRRQAVQLARNPPLVRRENLVHEERNPSKQTGPLTLAQGLRHLGQPPLGSLFRHGLNCGDQLVICGVPGR
jgi:hypothetical protein